jgi:peptide/nickel transport system ATP-binding protein
MISERKRIQFAFGRDADMEPRTQAVSDLSTRPDGRTPLLQVRDLRVWFELRRWVFSRAGYVRAVDGISFDLYPGEVLAIVGESGSGKSTLIRTLLGLHRPIRGSVSYQGKDLRSFTPQEMRWYRNTQVGYVQQDPYGALPPFMSVRQILEEPMIIGGIRDRRQRLERIREVMEEVKLTPVEEFLFKFPHMLSGGQQQRVVIARAILMRPRLLIADEPVSMLDASIRVEVLKLLQALQRRYHLSVIYVTHDLATATYFADRIIVMYAGKVVERAPMAELLAHAAHPYTVALLTALPDPDPENAHRLKEVPPGEPPNLIAPPPGCRFHPRCPRIIQGLCDREEPPDFEVGPGHRAACWLYRP